MLLKNNYSILTLLAFFLSGCITAPISEQKEQARLEYDYLALIDMKSSPHYDGSTTTEKASSQFEWWTLFEDNELNLLMNKAFIGNPNISQIRARLDQANAQARRTRATSLPALDATIERSTSRGDNRTPSEYSLQGAASFELDLWNKNSSSHKSDVLEAEATEQDLYGATITLSATLVENWLDILSLLEQEQLLRKQVETNRTVLDLQRRRFEMGSSAALDILQQEEVLASSEARLPDILSEQKSSANNIALLLGNTPYEALTITQRDFPEPLPIPNTGIPSDLLENRPDIKAAWLRVQSAEWAQKAAWADRLPSFNISATSLTSDNALDGLFNSWLLNLVGAVTAPIFDGGQRKAEELRQEALADERFHFYRETVLAAVVDVENALVRNRYQDEKLDALKKQLTASKKTLEQAQISYINGNSSYINVLTSLNNTQSLELEIATEKLLQAKERVRLYRSLGGSIWVENMNSTYNLSMRDTKNG